MNFITSISRKSIKTKAELLLTDTDSLIYEIHADDFYKDITPDVEKMFDTSDYPKSHPSGIPTGLNKKVIGLMKDVCGGKIITEFVGLRPKLYSYRAGDKEDKKCKGVKKNVIDKEITFDNYKDCLFNEKEETRHVNLIRHRNHDLFTERIEKVVLSAKDDKRLILPDKIKTLAFGHYMSDFLPPV